MRNNKGSILFYVLSFFVYFMIFFESALNIKIKQEQVRDAIYKIELRLRIETKIIEFYRENESLEPQNYHFFHEDVYVNTNKIENNLKVNLSGAITHTFYYVIMEDGSFTFTTLEEKNDYIK